MHTCILVRRQLVLLYIGYLQHRRRAYICPLDRIRPYLPFGRRMQSTAHLHRLLGLPNQLPLDKLRGKRGQRSPNSRRYSVCRVGVYWGNTKTEVRWACGGCAISPYKEIVDNECWYHGLMGAREIRPYITVALPLKRDTRDIYRADYGRLSKSWQQTFRVNVYRQRP